MNMIWHFLWNGNIATKEIKVINLNYNRKIITKQIFEPIIVNFPPTEKKRRKQNNNRPLEPNHYELSTYWKKNKENKDYSKWI